MTRSSLYDYPKAPRQIFQIENDSHNVRKIAQLLCKTMNNKPSVSSVFHNPPSSLKEEDLEQMSVDPDETMQNDERMEDDEPEYITDSVSCKSIA